MGGVADFVSETLGTDGGGGGLLGAIEDVGQAVWEPIEQVGQIAESAVREVGHAVESVGREVGKIGQAAINDPAGTMLKVAAVASGQWWALPLVSAGLVIANGGDIGQAALAAGISLAAAGVAYGVGEMLGAGSSAGLDMATPDAINLANQGLSSSQIAQVLGQSYPAIGSSAISQIADFASMGIPAAEIISDVGSQMALQNLGASTAANALGSGTRTALSGGDLSDILSSAGTAGLGTGVGGATSMGLGSAGIGSTVAGAVGKGAGAALTSAVAGKDGTSAFLNSLINTSLSETGGQVKSYLKGAWDKVTTAVDEYNKQLETANETQAKLDPLFQTAKEAEAAINEELAAYQPVRDKFSDLVKQYDDAKAAGNVELANSLADQANAMIPELNAATDKYNAAYADYEAKVNPYLQDTAEYKAQIEKADALKEEYTKSSEELTAETAKLSEAAAKVAEMPEPVQHGFAKMYQNGTSVDEALENANTLKGMTSISQETFNRNLGQTSDVTKALELANTVNSLDTKQQAAYQTGIITGLDDSKALEIAPVISNFSSNQQNAYVDAIKRGIGQEGADLISAFASFAPEQTTTAPATTVTPATRDIASEFTKLNAQDQATYKQLVNNRDPSLNLRPDEALETIKSQYKAPSDSSVIVEQGGSGSSALQTQDQKAALYKAAYDSGSITKEEYNQALTEAGISKPTSIFNVGDSNSPTGPNTGLVNTGTGTGGQELNSPNSLYTPLSFGTDGAVKTYYGTDGEIYSVLNINGEDTLVNEKNPEIRTPIKFADIDPITKKITVPQPEKTTTKGPVGGGSDSGGGGSQAELPNLAPTANTDTSTAPVTGSPSSSTLPTADFTSPNVKAGSSGTTAGQVTTGANVGAPSASSGTGTGSGGGAGSGVGTGVGSGSGSGTGTGTGSGTGSGSGSGSGIGIGLGTGTGYAGAQYLQSQDMYGGIKNLTPGLTQRTDYTLSGLPTDSDEDKVNPMTEINNYATGGSTEAENPYGSADLNGIKSSLTPGLTKAQISYILTGLPGHAEGGEIEGHNPQFFSEGGLGSIENRYVQGEGDGTSDSVAAMLANGEFVIPADVVSKLGNGSNEAGAGVLDQFLVEIRKHAHSNGEKLPPESKGPLGYLLDAKRKVKA